MNKIDEAIAQVIQKLAVVVDAHALDAVLLGGKVIQLTVTSTMIASTVCFLGGGFFIGNVLNPLSWAILFDARLAVAAKILGLI